MKSADRIDVSGLPDATAAPAQKRLKAAAVAMLMLALACVALALWASQRQTLTQGPWGLAVLPGGQVWLSVDEELWRLDADGQRQQVVRAADVGLPGAAGELMPHPAGHLAAWSRRSPTLHLLDAASAQPLALLTPQWPPDLARHGDTAISYAFAPDGRVAIAAGGGHTVALFDAQGRYLARSPPNTFYFTNGLWWADGGWWCTDTNRFALVRLNDADLTEIRRIALDTPQSERRLRFGRGQLLRRWFASIDPRRSWRFLSLAAASRGAARGGQAPLGTVARLANDMEQGHVVDVWPDGQQRAYPVPDGQNALQPRALAWLGDTLLVVDGQGFAIRRYDAGGQRLPDWGDAAVQTDQARRHAALQSWRGLYRLGLTGAVLLLLSGLGASVWERRLKQAPAGMEDKPRRALASSARAGWQTLASLLIPGLGQWIQGRFGVGLVYFVFWLMLMSQFVFAVWVAWASIMGVTPLTLWITGVMAFVPGLVAAVDAWRLRERTPNKPGTDYAGKIPE
ncbi:MAG: hypothetical protein LBI48_06955 [Burkholderiaceae bacterium]|jgi:hypothetical protein|nr:hypothetical protein [Burkholderiaceae bacterium]